MMNTYSLSEYSLLDPCDSEKLAPFLMNSWKLYVSQDGQPTSSPRAASPLSSHSLSVSLLLSLLFSILCSGYFSRIISLCKGQDLLYL